MQHKAGLELSGTLEITILLFNAIWYHLCIMMGCVVPVEYSESQKREQVCDIALGGPLQCLSIHANSPICAALHSKKAASEPA